MKREIKFRGIKSDTGEWIFGNLHVPDVLFAGTYMCPSSTFCDLVPGFEDGDDFEEIRKLGCAIGHFHKVDDDSVGQYTGIKDKNGVEVYEGDIVKFTRYGKYYDNGNETEGMVSSIHEVYFDDELLEFGLKYTFAMFHCQFANQFEVIGNIYDNPELLNN